MQIPIIATLCISLMAVGNAGEDCDTTHTRSCSHQTPSSATAACVTELAKCADFVTAASCLSATAYEWNLDFPTSCVDNGTSINSAGRHCWTGHDNCNSPNAQCYRTVTASEIIVEVGKFDTGTNANEAGFATVQTVSLK